MDLNLKDKVAIVTGGSRGIGKAICLSLAAEGVKVAVNYNSSPQKANEVVDEISKTYGTQAIAIGANVADESDVLKMFAQIEQKFSRIDILVNNAAYCPTCPVKDMPLDMWKRTLDVNLDGTFLCSRQFVKQVIDNQSKGSIVNIVSQAAFRGSTSGHAPYDASKGGMVSFTVALAREVATQGINVNAVSPGMVMTDMVVEVVTKNRDKYLNRIPLHRIAEPNEIADVVTFMASEKASYMTGATVDVSGGMLMR